MKNTWITDYRPQTHTPAISCLSQNAFGFNAISSERMLVHNHPSGDPTPSPADIDMTRMIVAAAKPLGVTIHDHIIVGRAGHASLKGMKLM